MPRRVPAIFFSLFLYGIFSCSSTKKIVGAYHTNFADFGFFGTTVRLKADSTLQYIFQGDLQYDSATGHYTIRGRKVYITFDKELYDATKLYYRFNNMPSRTTIIADDSIPYQEFFYVGRNKLFFAHELTGKKVTKARRYNKRKKYLLFGSHYYKKQWYLERHD